MCEPWATIDDIFECTSCAELALLESQAGPVPDSVALENLIIASNIVNRLSALQFGICEETVRPCCNNDLCGVTLPLYNEAAHANRWYHAVSSQQDNCVAVVCNTDIPELDLGVFPLDSIVSITVDGSPLDPSAYRIDDDRYLVRVDGFRWPSTQNLLLADTEEDTWSVTYRHGIAPPPEGVRAVADLACQLTLACAPPELAAKCKLPDYVVSVSRQGVTFNLPSLEERLRHRFINIASVDNFISYVNPNGLHRAPVVMSPTYNRRGRHRRVGA